MKIKFKNLWFSPGTTGHRYVPGVHKVPDELCERHEDGPRKGQWKFLPSSAVAVDKLPKLEAEDEAPVDFKDIDPSRAAANAVNKVVAEADEAAKKAAEEAKAEADERARKFREQLEAEQKDTEQPEAEPGPDIEPEPETKQVLRNTASAATKSRNKK